MIEIWLLAVSALWALAIYEVGRNVRVQRRIDAAMGPIATDANGLFTEATRMACLEPELRWAHTNGVDIGVLYVRAYGESRATAGSLVVAASRGYENAYSIDERSCFLLLWNCASTEFAGAARRFARVLVEGGCSSADVGIAAVNGSDVDVDNLLLTLRETSIPALDLALDAPAAASSGRVA